MNSNLIGILFPLVPLAFVLAVIYLYIRGGREVDEYGRTFLQGHSLADYARAHPESFRADGSFVRCHACGGRQFSATWTSKTKYGTHYSHVCRQCGIELWRTTL
ncbi:MAG: hypothetical protein K8R60_03860 [Burkholderiales bacterium]|nr:hypothetical protein [Burkholderiales bacterium]